MFLPAFFRERPEHRKQRIEREKKEIERRLSAVVPFDPKMKWESQLNLQADTYPIPIDPFPNLPAAGFAGSAHPHRAADDKKKISPCETWCYMRQIVKRGSKLDTISGNRKGDVVFDKPVIIPTLWHRRAYENASNGTPKWTDWEVLMSLTPFEYFSLRSGTRAARGHTIVAGLGLGYQLREVMLKRTVKKVTLVERDQGLVDWVLPAIRSFLPEKPLEIVVGNAHKELPGMEADVAVVDIFSSYGSNCWERDKLVESCKRIGRIWCWGTAHVKTDRW